MDHIFGAPHDGECIMDLFASWTSLARSPTALYGQPSVLDGVLDLDGYPGNSGLIRFQGSTASVECNAVKLDHLPSVR